MAWPVTGIRAKGSHEWKTEGRKTITLVPNCRDERTEMAVKTPESFEDKTYSVKGRQRQLCPGQPTVRFIL